MTLQLLNPRIVTSNSWYVIGSSTAFGAVEKGSGDASYVESTGLGSRCSLFCGDGRKPLGGFVGALLVTLRCRRSTASTGGSIDVIVDQSSTDRSVTSVVLPASSTAWETYTFRIRVDWTSGVRFTGSDLASLGVVVEEGGSPSSGSFHVSELFLEIEQVDSLMIYDPFVGVTPDVVSGDRQFITSGSQPGVVSGNYLDINDSSASDHRSYYYIPLGVSSYGNEFTTVAETVVQILSFSIGALTTDSVFTLAEVSDQDQGIELRCVFSNGSKYLGLQYYDGNPQNRDDYQLLEEFDWSSTHHYRLEVDRSEESDSRGLVRVYVDHNPEPLLEKYYDEFPSSLASSQRVLFGSEPSSSAHALIDYYSWWVEKRVPYIFRGWVEEDFSSNIIESDPTDSYISQFRTIPPGVTAGESNNCCHLIFDDTTRDCRIWSRFDDEAGPPVTYDFDVNYRLLGGSPILYVMCQRYSDLYYWNHGSSSWVSGSSARQLPYVSVRDQFPVFSGIANSQPDTLIFTFELRFSGPPPGPLEAWIYNAILTRS